MHFDEILWSLGGGQKTTDSILIQIWIQELFNRYMAYCLRILKWW